MGFFSSIAKGVRSVFRGVRKVFGEVLKPFSRILSNKWVQGALMAVTVFTGIGAIMTGMGTQTGVGAFMRSAGKFIWNKAKTLLRTPIDLVSKGIEGVGNLSGSDTLVYFAKGINSTMDGVLGADTSIFGDQSMTEEMKKDADIASTPQESLQANLDKNEAFNTFTDPTVDPTVAANQSRASAFNTFDPNNQTPIGLGGDPSIAAMQDRASAFNTFDPNAPPAGTQTMSPGSSVPSGNTPLSAATTGVDGGGEGGGIGDWLSETFGKGKETIEGITKFGKKNDWFMKAVMDGIGASASTNQYEDAFAARLNYDKESDKEFENFEQPNFMTPTMQSFTQGLSGQNQQARAGGAFANARLGGTGGQSPGGGPPGGRAASPYTRAQSQPPNLTGGPRRVG